MRATYNFHMLLEVSCLFYLLTSDSVCSGPKCSVTKQLWPQSTGLVEDCRESAVSVAAAAVRLPPERQTHDPGF